jgi:uncharacterized protein (TIGR03905 family)
MKHIVYQTSGTCSQQIDLDIDDENRVRNVQFLGGCNGNLQGVARLVEGMKVEEVKERLGGIRCGYKNTSCPDQLVRALEQAE